MAASLLDRSRLLRPDLFTQRRSASHEAPHELPALLRLTLLTAGPCPPQLRSRSQASGRSLRSRALEHSNPPHQDLLQARALAAGAAPRGCVGGLFQPSTSPRRRAVRRSPIRGMAGCASWRALHCRLQSGGAVAALLKQLRRAVKLLAAQRTGAGERLSTPSQWQTGALYSGSGWRASSRARRARAWSSWKKGGRAAFP